MKTWDDLATVLILFVWVLVVAAFTIWWYRATQFKYLLRNTLLEIKMVWGGLFTIPIRVPFSEIVSVGSLKTIWEIIPLVRGTFPTVWGKFVPRKMILISRENSFFPLVITPDDPDQFLQQILPLIKRT